MNKEKLKKIFFCIVIVVVFLGLFILTCHIYRTYCTYEIVAMVTDKGVKNYDDKSKYLVFVEDKKNNVQVFEITDDLLLGRFDSSNVYASVKVGATYKFTVVGFRVGLFSWYPNIYYFEEVKENFYEQDQN